MSCELTLTNAAGMSITVHELGATWTSCRVPLRKKPEKTREVLLAGADIEQTLFQSGSYAGAIVGRYAGRIANGRYQNHQLSINNGAHCLHGGEVGFSHRRWNLHQQDNAIIATLISPAGESGFPAHLTIEVHYILQENNTLTIEYFAKSDEETACNLTNHAYFNLNGGDGNDGLEQKLQIFADYFQPVGEDGIPNAPAHTVSETSFDFRAGKIIAEDFLADDWQKMVGGYDHSFLLDNHHSLKTAAQLSSADDQITLTVSTTHPAIHLYTGQFLTGMINRCGGQYKSCAGIALETQAPPDSPNQYPKWGILPAGKQYHHVTQWAFS